MSVSEEQLVSQLKDVADNSSEPPDISAVEKECSAGLREFTEVFDTWYNALSQAGLTEDLDPPQVSKEELISELERLEDALGHSPTGNDPEEHGKYGQRQYELVFGSYLIALEGSNVQPSYVQYNFASIDRPPEYQATKDVRYLQDHGPTPSQELPISSGASDRKYGMRKFKISAGKASGDSAGGTPTTIYYLEGSHDPTTVIETFFEENRRMLRQKSVNALVMGIGNFGAEWGEIGRKLVPKLKASIHEGKDDGVLLVRATSPEELAAVNKTVQRPTEALSDVDSVSIDSGYAWGLPKAETEAWEEVSAGGYVIVLTEDGLSGFCVKERVCDWNATKSIWAEFDDGIRVAGPDQPWPNLVVGTRGGSIPMSKGTLWTHMDGSPNQSFPQYIPSSDAPSLFNSDLWETESSILQDRENDEPVMSEQSQSSWEGTNDTTSVTVSETAAAIAVVHDRATVANAVVDLLRSTVDEESPSVEEISGPTIDIQVPLESRHETMIEALCSGEGLYDSLDQFVETALRSQLELEDKEITVELTVQAETAALLESYQDQTDEELEQLLRTTLIDELRSDTPRSCPDPKKST